MDARVGPRRWKLEARVNLWIDAWRDVLGETLPLVAFAAFGWGWAWLRGE